MPIPGNCQLIGRWRITGSDLWDRSYLDTSVPATMTIGADNHGEIAFGVLQAHLDLGYSRSLVFFTWYGADEMTEVSGDGHAELLDDGTIEITFTFDSGDEAIMRARRETSTVAGSSPSASRN
ncbi:hypothetical protein Sa4125_08180 [Aureimonas sp. SA4125]|nr:hypothetical protein Sa4125_08180 [Aureimonas sp. SA4125]